MGYQSPRTAAVIIERLCAKGFTVRRSDGSLKILAEPIRDRLMEETVMVPIMGTAPCGSPFFVEENVDAMIPISTQIAKPPHRHFLLRTVGDSMELAGIREGGLVLVRQQEYASDGDSVVALVDGEVTIKEFRRLSNGILLRPRSRDPKKHQPMMLTHDLRIQGIVVATISSEDAELFYPET